MIPLSWFLIFSAALFCTGLFGVLTRKNSIAILISVELMLNAAIINLLAFWRYIFINRPDFDSFTFAAVVFIVAAADTAVGLALIISAYRRRRTVIVDDLTVLKG